MRFGAALFTFLSDLKRHNNREWFEKNRARYVADVEEPMLAFVREVGERLPATCPGFVGDPRRSGGSMFRIYRDMRFSPDKSPYKTAVAAQFGHRKATRSMSAPGFYVHLSPTASFGGGGLHHPDTATLTRVRQAIVSRPKAWAAVLAHGFEIEGGTLKRPPPGYDAAHRFIADLKRKDFYVTAEFSRSDVTGPRFVDRFLKECARACPLMSFLAEAVGLER